MTSWPAPSEDRSTLISVRDLFGTAFRTSTGPETSPPGVDNVIVPAADWDVTLPNAARPPSAVTLLSITSSAVWARPACAQMRNSDANASRRDTALIGFSVLVGDHRPRVGVPAIGCAS